MLRAHDFLERLSTVAKIVATGVILSVILVALVSVQIAVMIGRLGAQMRR